MSKVKRLDLSRIRNEELGHFAVQIRDILHDTIGKEHRFAQEFAQPVEDYLKALDEKAPESLSLAAADAVADRAWGAFYYQLQASTRCMNDDVRNAANEVQAVFEQTDNPTELNFAAEYGAIRTLLERLESMPAAKHVAARTDYALADLRKAYDDFMALSSATTFEASTRVYGVKKEMRTRLTDAWKCVVTRLPALVDLYGDAKAAEAIDRINIVVERTRAAYRR